MTLKITKLENGIIKITSGVWQLMIGGDYANLVNVNTCDTILLDRQEIDDLIEALKETKYEMLKEHHG